MNSLFKLVRRPALGLPHRLLFSTTPAPSKDLKALMRTLPPKPEPPEDDSCCLTGCEFCVWDLYDDDMREYQQQAKAISEEFEKQGKPVPEELKPENLRDSIDPTMRAFLDLERELAMKDQDKDD
ncbi:hypothetical protein DL89DRAFT_293452 [Linderina pennispora]|uniref:Oxidoreductase-like domain-containing protein n=1 Tax=Linderina pennispora TaxID=61395 RepID=A0A1Y1W611_9FUNG|nr:uncharacterized protein DL89DRAFT_293452 [Linderina pennispora]ORX68969.1 hypothetical protein DL89DRAFT_293452 [Linderina pennispora]